MHRESTSFFTVLWTNDYCQFLSRAGIAGEKLRFVWGGHNQNSRFSHYRVFPGDSIIPIRVYRQALYVIASMRVKQTMTREEYVASHPLDELLILHSCANEILVGEHGTPISFEVAVPVHELEHLRFETRNGERGLKYLREGKLMRSVSLEGVFRLTPSSAEMLVSLIKKGAGAAK